jgi:DNA-binding HxlR family transcriptional regulator
LQAVMAKRANDEHRSGCPINLTLETLGDRWSLIVIRDVMFGNRRHFRELLGQSEEGIASNILADRLKRLVEAGLLSKRDDPSHKQKAIYSLTEPSIQLVPLLAQMGAWGTRHTPASEELSIRAELLEAGGPPMWEAFMEELRAIHLGASQPERSVVSELQAAYQDVVARKAGASPQG